MAMSPQDIRAGVVAAIKEIAPEVDEAELAADQPLRAQVDLDSMDWLNVIIGLHQRFDVQIPEADYGRLDTLDHIAAYLADKMVR
jgi:acyl carrier protein